MDITVETIQGIISNLGFPIFVAIFMLTKQSKESQETRAAINELTTAIKLMAAKGDDSK